MAAAPQRTYAQRPTYRETEFGRRRSTLQKGPGGAGRDDPNPLASIMVFDKLRELSFAADESAHSRLTCLVGALTLVGRYLDLDPKEKERHARSFLRVHGTEGSGKPNPKMPTWKWICSLVSHKSQVPNANGVGNATLWGQR